VQKLARCISWIGHPLVLVTASVGIVVSTQLPAGSALAILAVLFLSTIAPVGLLLFFGLRSGRWRDADVSVRTERRRFYPVAIPLSAAGTGLTWLIGAPGYILRGALITLIVLIVAGISNVWFKISLHALFAGYCAVVLFRVNWLYGSFMTMLALLVVWSRLFLKRHTIAETFAGLGLGLLAGVAATCLHG
jgi:membrane-associated phospholipid phosphatase